MIYAFTLNLKKKIKTHFQTTRDIFYCCYKYPFVLVLRKWCPASKHLKMFDLLNKSIRLFYLSPHKCHIP